MSLYSDILKQSVRASKDTFQVIHDDMIYDIEKMGNSFVVADYSPGLFCRITSISELSKLKFMAKETRSLNLTYIDVDDFEDGSFDFVKTTTVQMEDAPKVGNSHVSDRSTKEVPNNIYENILIQIEEA